MFKDKLVLVAIAVFVGLLLVAIPLFLMSDAPVAQGLMGSGVTNFDAVTTSGNLIVGGTADIASTLQYGADDLYALGFATSGQQVVYGSSLITGTAVAAHGLTTVTMCLCTLGEDPETGAGDSAACSTAVATNVCTLKAWQDDFTASTEVDTVIHWVVIGAP